MKEGWKVRTFEPDLERTAFIPLLLDERENEAESARLTMMAGKDERNKRPTQY